MSASLSSFSLLSCSNLFTLVFNIYKIIQYFYKHLKQLFVIGSTDYMLSVLDDTLLRFVYRQWKERELLLKLRKISSIEWKL